jgi:hypothetical protein
MKISDILTEVFDTKWELEVTPTSNHVYTDMKRQGLGNGGLYVWSKKDDPKQIIILINNNGYWEVHHAVKNDEGEFISGDRLDPGQGGGSTPNTGMIATAIDLYDRVLSRGKRIRITAPKNLWRTYDKVIDRMMKKYGNRLKASEVDDNFTALDGSLCSARTLQFEGKKINISPMKILK